VNKLHEPLGILIGNDLSSVEFVRDYVQLHFNGPTINAYNWPMLTVGQSILSVDTPGYRDALCSLISVKVVDARVEEGIGIDIEFEANQRLHISLRAEDSTDPEAAQFYIAPDQLWVW